MAYYNIRQRKLHTLYLIINMVIILTILLVWQMVSASLKGAQDEITYGRKSLCSVEIRNASKYENAARVLLQSVDGEADIQKWGVLDWAKTLGKDGWRFVNIGYVCFEIGGETYRGLDDYSFDFGGDGGEAASVRFETAILMDGALFSENDLCEYVYENNKSCENGLIWGRLPEADGEFVISDYMLGRFGVDEKMYDELIGQKATFTCGGEMLLSDILLVGIVDSNIFRCEGLTGYPQIILKDSEPENPRLCYETVYRINVQDYAFMEMLYGYLEKSDLGIEYSREGRDLAERLYIVSSSQKLIDRLLVFFGWFLLLVLVFNLFRVICSDMAEKKSNHGMMIILGMRRADILLLCAMELLYYIVAAVAVSGIISLWMVRAVIQILEMASGIEMCISYGYFACNIFLDGMGFGVLLLMAIALVWIRMREKTPYQMMAG